MSVFHIIITTIETKIPKEEVIIVRQKKASSMRRIICKLTMYTRVLLVFIKELFIVCTCVCLNFFFFDDLRVYISTLEILVKLIGCEAIVN